MADSDGSVNEIICLLLSEMKNLLVSERPREEKQAIIHYVLSFLPKVKGYPFNRREEIKTLAKETAFTISTQSVEKDWNWQFISIAWQENITVAEDYVRSVEGRKKQSKDALILMNRRRTIAEWMSKSLNNVLKKARGVPEEPNDEPDEEPNDELNEEPNEQLKQNLKRSDKKKKRICRKSNNSVTPSQDIDEFVKAKGFAERYMDGHLGPSQSSLVSLQMENDSLKEENERLNKKVGDLEALVAEQDRVIKNMQQQQES